MLQSEYKRIYQKVLISVKEELKRTLLTVALPVNDAEDNESAVPESHGHFPFSYTDCDIVALEEFCPCGSGKLYWQCHARRLDNKLML